MRELRQHLALGGRLLVTQASFGNPVGLEKAIACEGLNYEKTERKKFGVRWYLFGVAV